MCLVFIVQHRGGVVVLLLPQVCAKRWVSVVRRQGVVSAGIVLGGRRDIDGCLGIFECSMEKVKCVALNSEDVADVVLEWSEACLIDLGERTAGMEDVVQVCLDTELIDIALEESESPDAMTVDDLVAIVAELERLLGTLVETVEDIFPQRMSNDGAAEVMERYGDVVAEVAEGDVAQFRRWGVGNCADVLVGDIAGVRRALLSEYEREEV